MQDTNSLFKEPAPIVSDPAAARFLPSEALYESAMYERLRNAMSAGDATQVHDIFAEMKEVYATGTPERNVVDYEHAYFMIFRNDDVEKGIDALLAIANDETSYSTLTRALAIETLGRAAGVYPSVELRALIFKEEPFAEMLREADGDIDKATIAMYKHAVYVYPTPIAAMRVAQASARALEGAALGSLQGVDSDAEKKEFITYLHFADEAAKALEGKMQFNTYLADFYLIKASSFASLYFAGETGYATEITELYKKSANLAQGSVRAFALFGYAGFLSRSNTATDAELELIMRRIQNVSSSNRRLLDMNIKNAFASKEGVYYANAKALFESSETFRAYVSNLGITDVTNQ